MKLCFLLGLLFFLPFSFVWGQQPAAPAPGTVPAPGQPLIGPGTAKTSTFTWAYTSNGASGYIVSDTMRAVAGYYRVLGVGYVNLALARLESAIAGGEEILALRYRVINSVLEHQVYLLSEFESKQDKLMQQDSSALADAKLLKVGRTSERIFRSLGHLFTRVIPPAELKLILSVVIPPIAVKDCCSLQGRLSRAVDFPGGNAGTFLLYLKQNQLSLRNSSVAQPVLEPLLEVEAMIERSSSHQFELRAQHAQLVRQGILDVCAPKS